MKTNGKSFNKTRLAWWVVGIVLFLVVGGYVAVSIYGAETFNKVNERSVKIEDTPAKYGLAYQDVSFPSAAGDKLTLRGWWVPMEGANKALVIVHGINQNRSEMLYMAANMRAKGFSLLFFDLRAHGDSDGTRRFYGQKESWDVVGAFNYVKTLGYSPDKIGISARSYGAASSLLAMGRSSEIKWVFSDSAWADFEHVGNYRFTKEYGLPTFFMAGIFTAGKFMYGFDLNQTAPETVLRTLKDRHIYLVQGENDDLVPNTEIKLLKEAGGTNITGSWYLPGVGHCQAYNTHQQEFMQRFDDFFSQM